MDFSPHISRRVALHGLGAGLSLIAVGSEASAQTYPGGKPVAVIVPYGPGGTVDIYVRKLLPLVAPHLPGGSFIVDNRPGVGGVMGAIMMKATRPNGYTVTIGTEGMLRLPYLETVDLDIENGFTYICGLATFNFGIAVRKDSSIKTFAEFIEAGKQTPEKVVYAAGLPNTTMPLMMTQLTRKTGATYLYTPYKSGAEMLTAVLGGHVDAIIDSTGGFASHVDSGNLRLLATFGESRSLRWSDIPTAKELGFDVTGVLCFGLIGPAGMDKAVTETLHRAFKAALDDPQHVVALKELDTMFWYQSPENYKRIFVEKYKEYGAIFDSLGMKKP